jgi:hypothetical protein
VQRSERSTGYADLVEDVEQFAGAPIDEGELAALTDAIVRVIGQT